jgi:four helix bundle protein
MATIQRFEDLVVWQKARSLAHNIYSLTGTMPVSSDFRIKNQMRGSVGSIMDNIAEGFERGSRLEFVNALTVAKGEAGELKSQLYRCKDLQYLTDPVFTTLYNDTDEITKMLTGLIKYLNTAHHKGQKFKDRL